MIHLAVRKKRNKKAEWIRWRKKFAFYGPLDKCCSFKTSLEKCITTIDQNISVVY